MRIRWSLVISCWLILAACNLSCGSTPSGTTTTTSTTSTTATTTTTTTTSTTTTTVEISSWTFVDGNGVNGINKDPSNNASFPQLTVFNSKLYATWYEYNGIANNQTRVAVYNGNDSSPTWTFVDGNGVNGINKDYSQDSYFPQLTVFDSKLYATWRESNVTTNQIRVAVYNGNDSSPTWTFVDGNGVNGINKDPSNNASSPQLTTFNSKLYATWQENNGTANQIRVAVYNGNDSSPTWTFVDGNGTSGINKDILKNTYEPQLSIIDSKLYVTWYENNGTANQTRVAVYNGNDSSPNWTFVDGNGVNGINKDTSRDSFSPQLTVLSSKLYCTWYESNGIANQTRVAVYNSNDSSPSWTFVDGNGENGINKDASKDVYAPQLTVFNSKLYATWYEYTGSGVAQIRIKVYNGNDSSPTWTFVDGNMATGINKDTLRGAFSPQLTVFDSKLYTIWYESNGTADQIRVVVGQ